MERYPQALACALAACGGGDNPAPPQKSPSLRDPKTSPEVPNKTPGRKNDANPKIPILFCVNREMLVR